MKREEVPAGEVRYSSLRREIEPGFKSILFDPDGRREKEKERRWSFSERSDAVGTDGRGILVPFFRYGPTARTLRENYVKRGGRSERVSIPIAVFTARRIIFHPHETVFVRLSLRRCNVGSSSGSSSPATYDDDDDDDEANYFPERISHMFRGRV